MSKFCPIPWNMSAMRNNGDYRVCCHANISQGRGLILKDETPMNASVYGPNDVRNSPVLKQMRKEMMQGQWPAACERCQVEESSGLKSRRLMEVEKEESDFENKVLEHTLENGHIDLIAIPLERLDLRLGNKCNLKCRMCGPTDSDAWYSDHSKVWGDSFEDTHGVVDLAIVDGQLRPTNNDYNWISDESFWKSLESQIDNLKYIHIVGGEPLLIEEHFKFLKICKDRGVSRKITLEYNTNLSVLPEFVLELWRNFEEVKVGVSLDGVEELNDYIRYPSKWSAIEQNLKKLQSEESLNTTVWLSFSVQALNILSLVDVIRWKLNSPFHKMRNYFHKKVISTHPVHKPHHLSTQALPLPLKESVQRTIRADLQELLGELEANPNISSAIKEEYRRNLTEMIEGHISFMMKRDLSHEFSQFLSFNKKLDDLRGQSLAKSNPKLWNLINEAGLDLN